MVADDNLPNIKEKEFERKWLSVQPDKPKFKLLSYNVLADCLTKIKKANGQPDSSPFLEFNTRFPKIAAEITGSDADIVLL